MIPFVQCLLLCSIAVYWAGTLASAAAPAEIWVAPDGSDQNAGTYEAPLASVDLAQRKARELRRLQDPSVEEGVHVVLRGGTYRLLEPLLVRPEDSGEKGSSTVFRSAKGETARLSGGVPVTGWRIAKAEDGLPEAAQGKVWVAEAPRVGPRRLEFRDMWVDGRRADRARDSYGAEMNEILVWDRDKREAWIPAPEGDWEAGPGYLEMVVHQMWAIAILRVKTLDIVGDRARLTFHEPESRLQFEKPWPFVWMRGQGNDSPYYLTNSMQLLTRPGEWYQDPDSGQVYYWPRDGERMDRIEVVAPHLETLLRVAGTVDRPVSNVLFQGIEFSHTTWMRPAYYGHVPLQAGFYMYEGYSLLPERGTPGSDTLCNQAWVGRKPAAVEVEGLLDSGFERCHFTHLASAGLDFVRATRGNRIEGNTFRDIGGNGIVMGAFQEEGVETHLPYNPKDRRELCRDEVIANNLLTDVANTDWGCVGIIAGFVSNVVIEYNEISDVSYTGISLGWGWVSEESALEGNHVRANHVHHYGKHMYDTAGIYTLSSQPGSSITRNSVHSICRPSYVHDPHHWSYIYLDEGSDHFVVKDNWTESVKFSTNRTGANNVWKRTGPHAPDEIRRTAGPQPEFRDLLYENK